LETDVKIARYDPAIIVFNVISMLIICCRVYEKDRKTATMIRDWEVDYDGQQIVSDPQRPAGQVKIIRLNRLGYYLVNGESISIEEIRQRIKDHYKNTKVILAQSVLFFSVLNFSLIIECFDAFSLGSWEVVGVEFVIWSVQGFYQLFIFIFHKVFNHRRHDPDISISRAIIEIFQGGPGSEAIIIANINVVRTINKEMESSNIKSVESGFMENQSESMSLLSSCGMTGHFGSLSLPTAALVADDSDFQPNYIASSPLHINDEYSRLSMFTEEYSSAGLSGFTKELEDGNQQSLGKLDEQSQ